MGFTTRLILPLVVFLLLNSSSTLGQRGVGVVQRGGAFTTSLGGASSGVAALRSDAARGTGLISNARQRQGPGFGNNGIQTTGGNFRTGGIIGQSNQGVVQGNQGLGFRGVGSNQGIGFSGLQANQVTGSVGQGVTRTGSSGFSTQGAGLSGTGFRGNQGNLNTGLTGNQGSGSFTVSGNQGNGISGLRSQGSQGARFAGSTSQGTQGARFTGSTGQGTQGARFTGSTGQGTQGARFAGSAGQGNQVSQQQSGPVIPILEDVRDGPWWDGSYYFRYNTGNGIFREEGAAVQDDGTLRVTGDYSYTAPNGRRIERQYISGSGGYQEFPAGSRSGIWTQPQRVPSPPPFPVGSFNDGRFNQGNQGIGQTGRQQPQTIQRGSPRPIQIQSQSRPTTGSTRPGQRVSSNLQGARQPQLQTIQSSSQIPGSTGLNNQLTSGTGSRTQANPQLSGFSTQRQPLQNISRRPQTSLSSSRPQTSSNQQVGTTSTQFLANRPPGISQGRRPLARPIVTTSRPSLNSFQGIQGTQLAQPVQGTGISQGIRRPGQGSQLTPRPVQGTGSTTQNIQRQNQGSFISSQPVQSTGINSQTFQRPSQGSPLRSQSIQGTTIRQPGISTQQIPRLSLTTRRPVLGTQPRSSSSQGTQGSVSNPRVNVQGDTLFSSLGTQGFTDSNVTPPNGLYNLPGYSY